MQQSIRESVQQISKVQEVLDSSQIISTIPLLIGRTNATATICA